MIRTQGLSVHYEDGRLALNLVSITVAKGEVYCLLGPRGAGKTTLHNALMGLVPLAAGRATVSGFDCTTAKADALKNMTFLSEKPTLYEYLSCRGNIELLVRLSGGGVPSLEALVSGLRELNLPDRILEVRVKELSPVRRQKLLLAAALVRHTPALLLDDPPDHLDAVAAREFLQDVRTFKSRGVAVLLTTHHPSVARAIADRVGVLDRGLITNEMDPWMISDKELFMHRR
jgi:ABC-2 type transport system ATP-binding protein